MAEQYTRIVTLTLLAATGWLPLVSCIPFPGAVTATITRPGCSLETPTGSTPPTAACRTIGAYACACARYGLRVSVGIGSRRGVHRPAGGNMARLLGVFAGEWARSSVLKSGVDAPDLGVECLCERGGLVYNAMAYAAGYCNISINKPEKKKKPCVMTVVGLSQGLRPIGLNLLAITSNNTVIIRDGQGLSSLLSYILAPSPHIGGMHGNYFGSQSSQTKYTHSAIFSCRSAYVDRYAQAADCCLYVDFTYCVVGKKKGRMRQHPALFIFLIVSNRSNTDGALTPFCMIPTKGGVMLPRFIC